VILPYPEHLTKLVERVEEFRAKELQPIEHDFDAGLRGEVTRLEGEGQGTSTVSGAGGGGVRGLTGSWVCLVSIVSAKSPIMFDSGSPEPALYLCNDEQKELWVFSPTR